MPRWRLFTRGGVGVQQYAGLCGRLGRGGMLPAPRWVREHYDSMDIMAWANFLFVQQLVQADCKENIRSALLSLCEWNLPSDKWILLTNATAQRARYTESISMGKKLQYRQVSNIRRTLVGNKIVDHSDVIGASPVGAAPTTSPLST